MENPQTTVRATGRCLCGAVAYEIHGPMRPVIACHCDMCRRASGHFVAATACRSEHLHFTQEDGLRWFQSSEKAQRGFCGHCGSNLFWKPLEHDRISIMAGSLDKPTNLSLAVHIYANQAGDYYRIYDNVPQRDDGEHGVEIPVY